MSEVNEIVVAGNKSPAVPMDSFVNLLADDRECAAMIDWWTKRRKMVREQLADILGTNTSGTVNGQLAITYEPINQFNTTDFKKKYPDMAHLFEHRVSKVEIDVERLKETRPDLYNQFRTRVMRVTFEPPGKIHSVSDGLDK